MSRPGAAVSRPVRTRGIGFWIPVLIAAVLVAGAAVFVVVKATSKDTKPRSHGVATGYGMDASQLAHSVAACQAGTITPLQRDPDGISTAADCDVNTTAMHLRTFTNQRVEALFAAGTESQSHDYAAGRGWLVSFAGFSGTTDELNAAHSFVAVLGGSFYEVPRPRDMIAESMARDDDSTGVSSYASSLNQLVTECGLSQATIAVDIDASLLISTLAGKTATRLSLMKILNGLATRAGREANCADMLANYVTDH